MAKQKAGYAPGRNPKSLENLIREGRPSGEDVYGEPKKRRTLTVTESGWQGALEIAKAFGCSSVSDYLEKLGRGEIASISSATHSQSDQDNGSRGAA